MKDAPPLPHLSLSKLGFLFHSCKQNNINIGFLFHYKTPLWALCFIVIHQKENRTEKHRPANLLTAFCYFPFVSLKKASVCAFVRYTVVLPTIMQNSLLSLPRVLGGVTKTFPLKGLTSYPLWRYPTLIFQAGFCSSCYQGKPLRHRLPPQSHTFY